jgi:hypothetical protein
MLGKFIKGRGQTPPRAEFTMTLVTEDCEGDLAHTNLLTVNPDPAFV